MHVGAVLGSGAEPCDVELAQLSLLWQFDVMAEITVVSLEEKHRRGKAVVLEPILTPCLQRQVLLSLLACRRAKDRTPAPEKGGSGRAVSRP